MEATTKNPSGSGLLWSNTSRPMVGYGFQDGEWKSGDVLYSNVLFWNASVRPASLNGWSRDRQSALVSFLSVALAKSVLSMQEGRVRV